MRTQRTDSMTQRQRLSLTGNDHDDLPTIQNGAHTHGQRHPGHLGDIPLEETRVGEDSVVRKCFDPRTRNKGRPRFVEGDMPILAYPPQEQLDPAVRLDGCFVGTTFGNEVLCVSVEDVDLGGGYVDVGEEFAEHECVVGFGVVFGELDVFVHVECDDVFEAVGGCWGWE